MPIVMFHGYADSADTWRQTLARLARAGPAGDRRRPARGSAPPIRCHPEPILPQLDSFAAAAARYARRPRPRSRCWPSATRSADAWRCGWPSAVPRTARRRGGGGAGGPRDDPTALPRAARPACCGRCWRCRPRCRRRHARRRRAALPPAGLRLPARGRPAVVSAFTWHHRDRATRRAVPRHGASADPRAARHRSSSIGSRLRCCWSGATATGSCSTGAPSRSSTRCPELGSSCSAASVTARKSRRRSASPSCCSSSAPGASLRLPERPASGVRRRSAAA